VEKFSTEVVLQNYRGELTMLGGRAGGAGEGAMGGADEFGQSSPMERPRMGGSKAQIPARDLDDEVPF
jgi:single-strand DNA-binding protein